MTTSPTSQTSTGGNLARRYFEVIEDMVSGRSTDADLRVLFADDATWTFPGDFSFSGTHCGRDAIFTDFFAEVAKIFTPALRVENLLIVAEGETAVAEYEVHKTAANGNPFQAYIVQVFESEAGSLTCVREYVDTAYVRRVCY